MERLFADVVIVGAGIVGAATACALADLNLSVLLIDHHDLSISPLNTALDLRISAINEASCRLFRELHVWDEIALRVSPYEKMLVWNDKGVVHFDAAEISRVTLGHIIENKVMLSALLARAQAHPNIQLLSFTTPQQLYQSRQSIRLMLSSGQCVEGSLLIGADGARSVVREISGIALHERPYDQTAIIANIKTEKPHHKTARQRFTPAGPLAFLPLRDPYLCSIVWSQDTARANKLLSMSDENFARELNHAFEATLGELTVVSERMSFPLQMRHAKEYVADRVVLLGDAIHTIHPLAGLGLNLGLKDVACLRDLIQTAVVEKRSIASSSLLAAFQRERKGENWAVLVLMRGFKTLFGYEDPWLGMIRNEGMRFVDTYPAIKKAIAKFALEV